MAVGFEVEDSFFSIKPDVTMTLKSHKSCRY